jgi:hypothetical protein
VSVVGWFTCQWRELTFVLPLPVSFDQFFVPLQEQSTFDDGEALFGPSLLHSSYKSDTHSTRFFVPLVFQKINNKYATDAVTVMLSVTISTDKTVVWYDHWEDGYDVDVASTSIPISKTTEIWGDGNAANGCAPHIRSNCTNINDILNAGTSIVVRNDVPLPRNAAANVMYDGGDKILSSFPVAVTRASFPKNPGSVLAGAGTCIYVYGMRVFATWQWVLHGYSRYSRAFCVSFWNHSRSVRYLDMGNLLRGSRW